MRPQLIILYLRTLDQWKQDTMMVPIDVRQAFQPDVLAGAVNLERLTYVELYHHLTSFWYYP